MTRLHSPNVISQIKEVIYALENSQMRAMDAIHVACALEWEAQLFVTSDHKQFSAAKKLGLKSIFIE